MKSIAIRTLAFVSVAFAISSGGALAAGPEYRTGDEGSSVHKVGFGLLGGLAVPLCEG